MGRSQRDYLTKAAPTGSAERTLRQIGGRSAWKTGIEAGRCVENANAVLLSAATHRDSSQIVRSTFIPKPPASRLPDGRLHNLQPRSAAATEAELALPG